MMRIFLVLFLALLTIAPSPAAAEERWSLDSCMAYAARNGYSIDRARRNLQVARNNYTSSIGSHLPSLGVSVGASSGFGRGIDPGTNTYQNTASFNNGYNLGLGLPIFNAFSLLNSTLRSKAAVASARSQIEQASDELSISVMEAWADAAFKAQMWELTAKRVEIYRTDLRLASRRFELGQSSAADVAQIAAALAGQELSVVERENGAELALLELKRRMNFPIEDTLRIFDQTSLASQTDRAADKLGAQSNLGHLPRVAIMEADLKMEKYSLRIARSRYYPSISASAGVSTNYYTMLTGQTGDRRNLFDQLLGNMGQSVGVNMSIPVFSGLSVRSSARSAKIRYDQAQSDYNESMRALRTEIKAIEMEVTAAIKKVEQARRAVEAADLAYRAVKSKYAQGVASVIDLQTVSNQLFAAEVELTAARLTLEIKSREEAYFGGESLIK